VATGRVRAVVNVNSPVYGLKEAWQTVGTPVMEDAERYERMLKVQLSEDEYDNMDVWRGVHFADSDTEGKPSFPATAVARLRAGDFSYFLDTRAGDERRSVMLAMQKADHRTEGGDSYSAAGFCHQDRDRPPQITPREYECQPGVDEPLLSLAGPLATIEDIEDDTLDDIDMNGAKRVRLYEAYLNRVYEDDVSKFLYEVIYMYYDVLAKKVVAVVRPLDSAPEDGVNGVIELVQAYEARRKGEIAVLRPLQDRATMRRLQESDPIIGPVYRMITAAGEQPIRHKLFILFSALK
jgi:hypothetical protein